jgi:hypothetical protein
VAAIKKIVGRVFKKRKTLDIESLNEVVPIKATEKKNNELLSKDEEQLLLKLAKNITKGQSCVCAGKGESIIWLTRGIKKGRGVKIYIINPLENYNIANSSYDALTPEELANSSIDKFESSEQASRKCREKVGLLCISTPNSPEDLRKTINAWQPKLALDAKVAVHGCDLPIPARIIKEYLGEQGDFTLLESVSRTAVLSVDKCIHHWMIDSHEIGICKYCGRKRNFKRIRSGLQGVESPKKEDLPQPKKVKDQMPQPTSKKKKATKRRRAWNIY